ncbi:MAG: hypothetical protein GDA56_18655 [Hormoscilla sp. GM7CHS1pb]|nr:hypothetical protein [Hormoscilla sp. GM7CHS1pb]
MSKQRTATDQGHTAGAPVRDTDGLAAEGARIMPERLMLWYILPEIWPKIANVSPIMNPERGRLGCST